MRLEGNVAMITGGARGMAAVNASPFANEASYITGAELAVDRGFTAP